MIPTRAEERVRDRVLTGAEVLARQKEPPPSRRIEQERPIRYGGGNSPVRHQVVISPEDWGKLAMWTREGYLAVGDSPSDGQIYGRQNGVWVPVSGVGPSTAVRWDEPGVNWDEPGTSWDQVARSRVQPQVEADQVALLWDQVARQATLIISLQQRLAALEK